MLVVDFSRWLKLKVTSLVALAKTHEVGDRVIFDVAHLARTVTLCPLLAICADVEIIIISLKMQKL